MWSRALLILLAAACSRGGGQTPPPAPQTSKLEVIVIGSGTVSSLDHQECQTAQCSFDVNGSTTLLALASENSRFVAWEGLCRGSGNCIVTAPFAGTLTARFEAMNCDVSAAKGAPVNFKVTAGIRTATLSWTRPAGFDSCTLLEFQVRVESGVVGS